MFLDCYSLTNLIIEMLLAGLKLIRQLYHIDSVMLLAASIMVFKADILQKLTFNIQVQTILYLVRDMVSFPHSEQDG